MQKVVTEQVNANTVLGLARDMTSSLRRAEHADSRFPRGSKLEIDSLL